MLSIPRDPSEFDDGLLTSSEVAQLKLNADWVVLSACNTIAGDKPGAEALSGLARSFFLRRCASAAGVTLVGGFGSCNPPHHRNLRSHEIRSKTRPRRGVASGDAGLSCRRNFAQKCISGILDAICVDRRGGYPLNGINYASQGCDLGWSRPMVVAASGNCPTLVRCSKQLSPKGSVGLGINQN